MGVHCLPWVVVGRPLGGWLIIGWVSEWFVVCELVVVWPEGLFVGFQGGARCLLWSLLGAGALSG